MHFLAREEIRQQLGVIVSHINYHLKEFNTLQSTISFYQHPINEEHLKLRLKDFLEQLSKLNQNLQKAIETTTSLIEKWKKLIADLPIYDQATEQQLFNSTCFDPNGPSIHISLGQSVLYEITKIKEQLHRTAQSLAVSVNSTLPVSPNLSQIPMPFRSPPPLATTVSLPTFTAHLLPQTTLTWSTVASSPAFYSAPNQAHQNLTVQSPARPIHPESVLSTTQSVSPILTTSSFYHTNPASPQALNQFTALRIPDPHVTATPLFFTPTGTTTQAQVPTVTGTAPHPTTQQFDPYAHPPHHLIFTNQQHYHSNTASPGQNPTATVPHYFSPAATLPFSTPNEPSAFSLSTNISQQSQQQSFLSGHNVHHIGFNPPNATVPPYPPAPPPVQQHVASQPPYQTPHGPNVDQYVRLPELKMKTFDGTLHEYPNFKQIFMTTIDAKPIPSVLKLQHLRNLLRDKAYNAISGYNVTSENYPIVLQTLDKQFGNITKLKTSLYNELDDLHSADAHVSSLRTTWNTITRINQQLLLLNESINNTSHVRKIFKKFPNAVLRKVLKELHPNQHSNATQVMSAFDIYIEQQEMANHLLDQNPPEYNAFAAKKLHHSYQDDDYQEKSSYEYYQNAYHYDNDNENIHSNNYEHVQSNHCKNDHFNDSDNDHENSFDSTESLDETSEPVSTYLPCLFCDGNHRTYQCDEYTTVDERQLRLKDLKRCFICLRSWSRNHQCPPHYSCLKCDGQHHAVLCSRNCSQSINNERQHHSNIQVNHVNSSDLYESESESDNDEYHPIYRCNVISLQPAAKSAMKKSTSEPNLSQFDPIVTANPRFSTPTNNETDPNKATYTHETDTSIDTLNETDTECTKNGTIEFYDSDNQSLISYGSDFEESKSDIYEDNTVYATAETAHLVENQLQDYMDITAPGFQLSPKQQPVETINIFLCRSRTANANQKDNEQPLQQPGTPLDKSIEILHQHDVMMTQ